MHTNGHKPNKRLDDEARAQAALDSDQTLSDADQTVSDSDQSASDGDQVLSDSDQRDSDSDQDSADRDQAVADEEMPDDPSCREEKQHERSRAERQETTRDREQTGLSRAKRSASRFDYALRRDESARFRDKAAAARDRASGSRDRLGEPASDFRARAAQDRLRAAADRERAAVDREEAARDRMFAEGEIRRAHIDDLTGAFRREMGFIALGQEMNRASRGDGRLVLAFVDVDGLKQVNDAGGHGAGDALLVSVVSAIRARLRSYDPVIRLGGDEFVCAISDADVEDARHAFDDIRHSLARTPQRATISVGFAEMQPGDTVEDLVSRGDASYYVAKASGEAAKARD